jgi:hypothetical protein
MKKTIFISILLLVIAVVTFGQVTDSTATVTYTFGDTLSKFFSKNLWTLIFVGFTILSEWLGQTGKVKEGSIYATILNWIGKFIKSKAPLVQTKKAKFMTDEQVKASKPGIIPKILILSLILSGIGFTASAQKTHPLRWYPFEKQSFSTLKSNESGYSKDSTLFFGASIAYDVFIKEMKSGDYSIGTMPGFGYGIKWNPKKNPFGTASLLSFDVFGETRLDKEITTNNEVTTTAKYFNIKFLPMIGILDWVHVGCGPLFKIGVNGNKSYTDWMFAISISKTL